MRNSPTLPRAAVAISLFAALLVIPCRSLAQEKLVVGQIKIQRPSSVKPEKAVDYSEVVVWLVPSDRTAPPFSEPAKRTQVIQKNKAFHPHVTVVRVGSTVDFPNRDPFFHNVFSMFDGKRFDLGLYEAGATNSVRFDHPGVSFLFCNIHPEMSAVVVAVDTPYYGVSDKNGLVSLPDVPDGKYQLHVWYERTLPDALKGLTRTVQITGDARELGTLVVLQDPGFSTVHKNKYGQDYSPPPNQTYPH